MKLPCCNCPNVVTDISSREKKSNRAPRLPQTGLRPQHPERCGTGGGTARCRRQRKSRQRATHDPRCKHSRTHGHSVVRNRGRNPENRGGKNGAHNITPTAVPALQEGERIQEPGHATHANHIRIKRVPHCETTQFCKSKLSHLMLFQSGRGLHTWQDMTAATQLLIKARDSYL
jgi:hypothetical protein